MTNKDQPFFCDRCDKALTTEPYYFDDQGYCGNCMDLLEYQAEAAWEAQQEESV